MVAKRLALLLLVGLQLMVASCNSMSPQEEIEGSEERGQLIVGAINQFDQEHGRFPEQLDELLPNYLSEVPLAVSDEEFVYKVSELEGYTLCFRVTTKRKTYCCYTDRFSFWDCGGGH